MTPSWTPPACRCAFALLFALAAIAVSERICVDSQPCAAVKSETAIIHIDVGQ